MPGVITPPQLTTMSRRNVNNWPLWAIALSDASQNEMKYLYVKCYSKAGCGKIMYRGKYRDHFKLKHDDEYEPEKALKGLSYDEANNSWDITIIGDEKENIVKQEDSKKQLKIDNIFNRMAVRNKSKLSKNIKRRRSNNNKPLSTNNINIQSMPNDNNTDNVHQFQDDGQLLLQMGDDGQILESDASSVELLDIEEDEQKETESGYGIRTAAKETPGAEIVLGSHGKDEVIVIDDGRKVITIDPDIKLPANVVNLRTINGLRGKYHDDGLRYEQDDDNVYCASISCIHCGIDINNGRMYDISKPKQKNILNVVSYQHIISWKHRTNVHIGGNESKRKKGQEVMEWMMYTQLQNILHYRPHAVWEQQVYDHIYVAKGNAGNKWHGKDSCLARTEILHDTVM